MKTLAEHNQERRDVHSVVNAPQKNGIACPDCGAELWDTSPNVTLTTNPPLKNIHCGCGFRDRRVA